MTKYWVQSLCRVPLAVAVAVGIAAPAVAETLSDALVSAYRSSGLIEQNRAVLRAADEDVAQAATVLRPVIDWAVGASYTNPTNSTRLAAAAGLTGSLVIYDFGRSKASLEVSREMVLATRAALLGVENTVLLNAVRAYLGVRQSQASVSLRENNVRLLNEQLRATQDRFDVGEVTRTDVSLAEAALAAARSGLAAEQGGLARAREQYKAAIGHYPGKLAAPPALPKIPANQKAGHDVALNNNPTLAQVQHQVAAAELGVDGATRARFPALTANGRVAVSDGGSGSESLTIQLSGPVYHGGHIDSAIRKAMAQRDQARASLYSAGLQVEQQVGNAYADLAVAIASIEASQRQVQADQLALDGVREELQLGARTTLDVLNQEQSLLDAQTGLVTAQVDRQTATYEVLAAVGLMTAQHLGLRVPIYDPGAYYNAVKDAPRGLVSPQGERLDRVMKDLGQK